MLGSPSSGVEKLVRGVAEGTLIQRLRALAVTIRGKILFAFCALATITGLLGLYAVRSVADSGRLVVETYDKPLMAISYARLALSDFTEMKLVLLQRQSAKTPHQERLFDSRIETLTDSLTASVGVAEGRSLSLDAAEAARQTIQAVAEWDAARRRLIDKRNDATSQNEFKKHGAAVVTAIDHLVEFTARDGFRHREKALSSIQNYHSLSIVATIGALLLSVVIAVLLARQMVRPIAVASHAAGRIAQGDLEVEVRSAGGDELGQLLESMAIMRDNIRAMMQREIDARRSAQTRLVNAIESSAEGVVLVDAEGLILHANSQLLKFFPDLDGAFEVGAPLPTILERVLTQPTHGMQLADGRWLRLSRSDTVDHGYVIICSDISALKERETVLQAAMEQAEAANRSKSQFLANMSHELRTPLNAIIGFSEIIRDAMMGPVSARYQEYAQDIWSSGSHLLSVINDTLDLSKIEGGQFDLYEETIDISDMITACHRIIRERVNGADLTLVLEIPENLPELYADQRRLKQVFLNLLSNAVKFTPGGGCIVVSARKLSTNEIEFSVADTGIGMKPDDVPLAFEPFRQIDAELNRRYEGTGLGLPLVQRLVDLHGGSLAVKSAPNEGTKITFVLPASRTMPVNAAREGCASSRIELSAQRIS